MNLPTLPHILHVDDDASVRAGFNPDVLIVDSQIDDDMDGAEVAEQIRIALGYSPPVIMLTGNPARAELPWIIDAPVWLAAKPVNPQLLLLALRHLVPLSREMRAELEPKKTHAVRGS